MTFQKLVEFCSYAGGQPCTKCGLSLNDMSDSMYERDKLRAENERLRTALVAVQDKIHDLYNRERDANDVYYEIQGVLDAAQSEGDPR